MKIDGCFDGVLSGFQECLKEVEWMFKRSLQGVSKMFQGSFEGVSRKIEGCSETPLRVIQGSLKVSKKVQRVFQGCVSPLVSICPGHPHLPKRADVILECSVRIFESLLIETKSIIYK